MCDVTVWVSSSAGPCARHCHGEVTDGAPDSSSSPVASWLYIDAGHDTDAGPQQLHLRQTRLDPGDPEDGSALWVGSPVAAEGGEGVPPLAFCLHCLRADFRHNGC